MNWTVLVVALITVVVSASIFYFDQENDRRTDRITSRVSVMVLAAFLVPVILALFIRV